jgi:hypothetical protein
MNVVIIFVLLVTVAANQKPNPKSEAIVSQMKDSKFFRETMFWIVNLDEQKVPFLQNQAQQKYYKEKTSDDLILKARKLGFSSEIEGDFFYDCLMTENTNAVTMAHTMDDTIVHMNRIKYYRKTMSLKNLEREFPVEITLDTDKATELYFPLKNSYYWIGTAGATGWGRGRQVTRAHGSEVSHWRDQSVLTAVLNARSRNARTVLETTANGRGEIFAELWYDAEDPAIESPWNQHFFAWWMDPQNIKPAENRFELTSVERKIRRKVKEIYDVNLTNDQLAWYRWELSRQTDKALMPQEYPSYPDEAFLSSGRHVFNLENLDVMESRMDKPHFVGYLEDDENTIREVDDPDGVLTVWTPPRENRQYIIPADICEGVKDGAFNIGAVMDRSSWEIAAEIRLRCDPGEFGRMMCVLGEYYNWALAIPEMNNPGHATLEAMKSWRKYGYPHILKTTDLWPDATEKLGFPTNEKTKALIVSALRTAIDHKAYQENSPVAIKEMKGAIFNEYGKVVSERGKNTVGKDKERLYLDCAITRMIGVYALKYLTLDDSYRDNKNKEGILQVTRIAGGKSERTSKPWMRKATG